MHLCSFLHLSFAFHSEKNDWKIFLIFSLDLDSYQKADLVKLDILLNGQPVDAMATIVHDLKAQRIGRELVAKLKKFIDRLVLCDC